MPHSDEPLLLLNACLGLARPAHGWPATFKQLGYELVWIDLEGHDEEGLLPELLLYSRKTENLLLISPHPGGWPKPSLLRRYASLRLDDLRDLVPVGDKEAAIRSLNVVVLGRADESELLKRALAPRAHAFPLLALSASKIRLVYNSFTPSEVNVTFALGVNVQAERAPREFLPLYLGSSDRELAESVVPVLVDYMVLGRREFNALEVARDVMPAWEAFSAGAQMRLTERVSLLLQVASAWELKDYLAHRGASWELRRLLRGLQEEERSLILDDLREQAARLFRRVEAGMQLILPDIE